LFDLETDPFEITNLAGEPAHAEPLADLRARLDAWIQKS
jgi:choline-sulfatase